MIDAAKQWDHAYRDKGESGVSWFQNDVSISLDLIASVPDDCGRLSVIDIGGGASRLVDALLALGHEVAVLDLSQAALQIARERLGAAAGQVNWIVSDVTSWAPARHYGIWHDRATFHFLTKAEDRAAYLDRLDAALAPRGHAIIMTFAEDGPARCRGLPVCRYDASGLAAEFAPRFTMIGGGRCDHLTPAGGRQQFRFGLFRRPDGASSPRTGSVTD